MHGVMENWESFALRTGETTTEVSENVRKEMNSNAKRTEPRGRIGFVNASGVSNRRKE